MYLRVFASILPASSRLSRKLGDSRFFDDMSDSTFDWLLSIPITYFKFELEICKKPGVTRNIYDNFITYLESLQTK